MFLLYIDKIMFILINDLSECINMVTSFYSIGWCLSAHIKLVVNSKLHISFNFVLCFKLHI